MKCQRDGRFVVPCKALREATEGRYGITRSGITFVERTNVNDLIVRARYYAIKSGKYKQRGLTMNYCPFCGVDIQAETSENKIISTAREREKGGEA